MPILDKLIDKSFSNTEKEEVCYILNTSAQIISNPAITTGTSDLFILSCFLNALLHIKKEQGGVIKYSENGTNTKLFEYATIKEPSFSELYEKQVNQVSEKFKLFLNNLYTTYKNISINSISIFNTYSIGTGEITQVIIKTNMENKEELPTPPQANFQECAQLEINNNYQDLKSKGEDALSLIFNMQKSIQEDVYGYNFDKIRSSIGELKKFIDWNEEALRDEDREMQAALTGIHTYPNCWKPWKSKHSEAMARPFSALREDELKELQMEWIDKLHFMMNEAIAIGLTPETITNYYVSKNLHNIERQKKPGGY